jgi:hypothetical protein
MADEQALPAYVKWPIFPFEGELRVKELLPLRDSEHAREGEPGGAPCSACESTDDAFVWVDDNWRVRGTSTAPAMPMQLFLESRAHVDMHELDDAMAAELGRLLVRLDRAVSSLGDVGRVHVNRWGDGGSHFHMWIYGRPFGTSQMLGFGVPLWAQIAPPIDEDTWRRNLRVVAAALAVGGGRSLLS